MLSPMDTALVATSYILNKKLVLVTAGEASGSHDDSSQVSVTAEELPLDSQRMTMNFNLIFRKSSKKELDLQRYSITCYSRSLESKKSIWCSEVWDGLVVAVREVCTNCLLQELVEATSSAATSSSPMHSDLWSDLYNNEGSKTSSTLFIERLSGWSSDGVQVRPEMLADLVKSGNASDQGKKAIIHLVKSAGEYIKNVTKVDKIMKDCGMIMDGLDILLTNPLLGEMVADSLKKEVVMATQKQGDVFEQSSLFAGELYTTLLITKPNPIIMLQEKYSCFRSLKNFPDVTTIDAEICFGLLQDALHHCQNLTSTALLKVLRSPNRTSGVGWMAAVVALNEDRAGPRFKRGEGVAGACGDGFMVNFSAVVLELCKPFFCSDPSGHKLNLISPTYPASPHCRLDLNKETCFAQGIINAEERREKGSDRFFPEGSSFKFVCECFFITQRALHVGLIPAMNTFTKILSDLGRQISAEVSHRDEKILKDMNAMYMLTGTCCLLDPQLVQYTAQFYITQSVWIMRILDKCHQEGMSKSEIEVKQRQLLSSVPEFCVRDMAVWFRLIVLMRPILLQGLQVTPFVDCCVSLLERSDLVPNPLTQSRIVSVLLAFVDSDQRGPHASQLLGAQSWGGILGELSAIVQASPAVRDHLGPALLHTYAEVNVVEGLDVDKEDFDKYATRFEIARLLLRLWQRDDCRQSILRVCEGPKFRAFLGAIFDTLLYQLNDGLSRLVNVKQYEVAKDNGQWETLPPSEKREKEVFLASEKRASRGFISQANKQMQLLDTLSEMTSITCCLCQPPLARRTAGAMLGFIHTLCGPKASELNVKDKEKYNFDPKKLLAQIASIILRVWTQECRQNSSGGRGEEAAGGGGSQGFLVSFGTHPEYSQGVIDKWSNVLRRHNLLDPAGQKDYTHFIEEVERLHNEVETSDGMDTSHASLQGAAGEAALLGRGNQEQDWQTEAERVDIKDDDLREFYQAALEGSKYDSADLQEVHLFASKAQAALDPRSVKVKAIMREIKQLEESLPVHPDSAIFLRQDEERLDLVRVLITGPVDTPYSRGCFIFDILYPNTYPSNPPIVFMTTTGGGTIRFNPNLYADGKVCLSLLGTWHGGDASEKWDPLRSNLLQVLLSIQGMIMIPDPMFNEPGYETIRKTEEGNSRSRGYNADIQVHTVRYAMVEHLRNPPTGFEDTVKVHFAIQREVILKQCSQWLKNAVSSEHERRLRKAVDELRTELDKI